MNIRIGDIVEYRTCASQCDDDLRRNQGLAPGEMAAVWRPALVLALFGPADQRPCINLRVFADGDGRYDHWRTSVQHVDCAGVDSMAWRERP